MASPSASSATLSIHSSQYGESWDDIDRISEDGSACDISPEEQLENECEVQLQAEWFNYQQDYKPEGLELASSPDRSQDFVRRAEDAQTQGELLVARLDSTSRSVVDNCSSHALSDNIQSEQPSKPIPTSVHNSSSCCEGCRSNSRLPAARIIKAIRLNLKESIKSLLRLNLNPNGVSLSEIVEYSTFFLRFRPQIPLSMDKYRDIASRETLLACMDLHQLAPLTFEEVEDRFWDGMAPFWCEEDFTPRDLFPDGAVFSSLIEAAKEDTIVSPPIDI